MALFSQALYKLNEIVWPLISCALLCVGLYLSVRLRFFQFRRAGHWLRETTIVPLRARGGTGVSPLSAALAALSGTIGTGNMAGVATAIAIGGPGAVFWMWVSALLGMATKYAEVVLAVKYKKRSAGGDVSRSGGAADYLSHAPFSNILVPAFLILALFSGITMGNMVQSNTVAMAFSEVVPALPAPLVGLTLAVLLYALGGRGAVGFTRITSVVVPVMCLIYLSTAAVILVVCAERLPAALASIFQNAFTPRSVGGGMAGSVFIAMRYGIGRGVFSNEAGLGISPFVHACSDETEPCRQGLFGIFEVFVDTVIICTVTALVLLCALGDGTPQGIAAPLAAWRGVFGSFGGALIAVLMLLFGFSTMLAWSFYCGSIAEALKSPTVKRLVGLVYPLFAIVGASLSLDAVWELSDLINALMALPNLVGLAALAPVVVAETRRYSRSLRVKHGR